MNDKNKHRIYIAASIFLWLMLSFISHAWIEIWYIGKILDVGTFPQVSRYYNCFLPLYLQVFILILGFSFGYVIGERWWRIVYVEKRHWKFRKMK